MSLPNYIFAKELTLQNEVIGFQRVGHQYIYLQLIFTADGYTTDAPILAKTHGLFVKSFGKLSVSYSLNENLLAPARYEVKILDAKNILTGILYQNTLNVTSELKLECQVWIKNGEAGSYIKKFSGDLTKENMSYDPMTKTHTLTFFPPTRILNETRLRPTTFDQTKVVNTDEPTFTPLPLHIESYPGITININIGYTLYKKSVKYDWTPLSQIIKRIIAQMDNPTLFENITLMTNLMAYGRRTDLPQYPVYTTNFWDFYVTHNWLGYVLDSGVFETYGDLLRQIAFELMSIVYMPTKEHVYFRPILYDDSNPQDMGKLLQGSHKLTYNLSGYISTHIKSTLKSQNYEQGSDYPDYKISELGATLSTKFFSKECYFYSELYTGQQVDQMSNLVIPHMPDYNVFLESVALPYIKDSGGNYIYMPIQELIYNFYSRLVTKFNKDYIREFIFLGTHQDFLRTFKYDNDTYSIIELQHDFDKNITKVGAIKIVDRPSVNAPAPPPVTPPPPPIDAYTLYNYAAVVSTTYETFNVSNTYTFGMVGANEILEAIEWKVEQEFEKVKIVSLRIYDDLGETFLTQDIMDLTEKNIDVIRINKTYTQDTALYLEIIKAPESLTQGILKLFVKKLRREF